jgi:membrane-associated phospholipid phosphatase
MVAADRSLGLRLTVAAVLAVLLLVPASLIGVLVVDNWAPLHDLDLTVTDALHGFAVDHPAWVRAMVIWCVVFAPNSLRLAAAVLVIWLWRRGASGLALWVAFTMTVGGVLDLLLKLMVGRQRPDLLDPVARAAGYAFPSGHALTSALAAGVFLLVLLPLVGDRRWLRAGLWAAAFVIPLITGICRVGLGVHWTSDVVAGWLLGVAVVAATAAGFDAWQRRAGRHRPDVAGDGVSCSTGEHEKGRDLGRH